jgi:hypothetical protein
MEMFNNRVSRVRPASQATHVESSVVSSKCGCCLSEQGLSYTQGVVLTCRLLGLPVQIFLGAPMYPL